MDEFAVGRFADISIRLEDASGIDPASIRLTVGNSGPLALGVAGMSFVDGILIFDSGASALGAYGATVSAILVVADTNGYTLTHSWNFKLEPEPQTAANLFVFGSPSAQIAGQLVSGPAAALASRIAGGPIKKNAAALPWSIASVEADRIIIAYTSATAPSFSFGQLICNLAPTKESEIFYRRVLSVSNDPPTSRHTVFTQDAPLTDFVSQGAISISQSLGHGSDDGGTDFKTSAAEPAESRL